MLRKHSLKDRQPLIPPSSVNISSDDRNLANKLEQLSLEADAIRLKMAQEEQQRKEREVKSKPKDAGTVNDSTETR